VLSTLPQVAAVVGDVRWTLTVTPDASVAGPYFRTPAWIVQPGSLFAASMVQLVPAEVGSVSLTVALNAEPAPLFVTETVNPIWSPAETEA
jgi:hypothetical protein